MLSPPHLLDGRRWRDMRVGLLGGSFNPAHEGHLNISLKVLRSLKLDCIWWLVTPQNPLKDQKILKPYEERLAGANSFVTHPRIIVSDLERQLGTNRTFDTLQGLTTNFPTTRFVWITGLDNALTFHRWYRWRQILDLVATAHIARPPASSLPGNCPLRMLETQHHIQVERPFLACLRPGYSYWLLQNKMIATSSTKLRENLS